MNAQAGRFEAVEMHAIQMSRSSSIKVPRQLG
jgi:hypothetical protein